MRALLLLAIGLAVSSSAFAARPPEITGPRSGKWAHETPRALAPDEHVAWGRLDNGFRYALLPHKGVPGRVSLQLIVLTGSLDERPDELGIAHAQAFAAGLLPDPQLSFGKDYLTHPGPGLSSAYNLGLSEDVTALLTRSSRRAAARSQAEQVNLDLLWAEWQSVAQARLLFDQVLTLLNDNQVALDRGLALLGPFYRVFNNTIGNGRWFDNYIQNLSAAGILGLVGIGGN